MSNQLYAWSDVKLGTCRWIPDLKSAGIKRVILIKIKIILKNDFVGLGRGQRVYLLGSSCHTAFALVFSRRPLQLKMALN